MAMQHLNLLEFLGMKWSQEWVKDVKIRKKKKGLIKFVLASDFQFSPENQHTKWNLRFEMEFPINS